MIFFLDIFARPSVGASPPNVDTRPHTRVLFRFHFSRSVLNHAGVRAPLVPQPSLPPSEGTPAKPPS